MCVYMLPYIHTELDTKFTCVCVYGYVHTQRVYTWVCKICIYTPSVHIYECIYLRLCVQSSNIHVGVMYLRVDTRSLGVGVYVCIYLRSLYGCVYSLVCLRVYVYEYTHGVYMCVYIYVHVFTYSVYIHVCTIAYIYTDFT